MYVCEYYYNVYILTKEKNYSFLIQNQQKNIFDWEEIFLIFATHFCYTHINSDHLHLQTLLLYINFFL